MRTHLDLFSGIGGFALAAGWAGYTTVGFVEYEDFPKRLLSRRFPGIPIHSDIHDFDATPFRGVNLLTGGFPCQPFSAAGKQRGKKDDRYLWKEMLRVIVEAQPRWVLAENVAGLINMALDEVLADLEAQDYATGTVILPACSQNALHRRDRVWIIAKRDAGNPNSSVKGKIGEIPKRQAPESRGVRPDVAHSESSGLQGGRSRDKRSEYSEEIGQRNQESLRNSAGSTEGDVAHSKCQSVRDKGSGQDASETSSSKGELRERQRIWSDSGECGTDVAYERIGSSYWETEPAVGRVADGIPNRVDRLKGLGNAIVPQVAYEIIRHFD